MENFIKVKAFSCNANGEPLKIRIPVELLLNPILVKVIQGDNVFIGGSEILSIGGNNYTDFKLSK